MELYPTFPTCREDTPKRQAEKQIYEAFKSRLRRKCSTSSASSPSTASGPRSQ